MRLLVKVTGPHPDAARVAGKPRAAWRVAMVDGESRKSQGKVYVCLSYHRAVSLSCRMAHDRKLFLHMEALPR